MTHIMCSTKQNDVKDAIKEMKRMGVGGTLTQVGKKLYSHLEKNQEESVGTEAERSHRYTINITTEIVHRGDCTTLRRVKDGRKISAAIVNVKATGLKTCGICM
jgi:hypothetical protein